MKGIEWKNRIIVQPRSCAGCAIVIQGLRPMYVALFSPPHPTRSFIEIFTTRDVDLSHPPRAGCR